VQEEAVALHILDFQPTSKRRGKAVTQDDKDRIRITPEDLGKPEVDEALAKQQWRPAPSPAKAGAGTPATESPEDVIRKAKAYGSAGPPLPAPGASPAQGPTLVSSTTLYTALAGGVGALLAWIVTEIVIPPIDNPGDTQDLILAHSAIWFSLIGALTGAALGSVEGIASRAVTNRV
jgi:hypothetical protein